MRNESQLRLPSAEASASATSAVSGHGSQEQAQRSGRVLADSRNKLLRANLEQAQDQGGTGHAPPRIIGVGPPQGKWYGLWRQRRVASCRSEECDSATPTRNRECHISRRCCHHFARLSALMNGLRALDAQLKALQPRGTLLHVQLPLLRLLRRLRFRVCCKCVERSAAHALAPHRVGIQMRREAAAAAHGAARPLCRPVGARAHLTSAEGRATRAASSRFEATPRRHAHGGERGMVAPGRAHAARRGRHEKLVRRAEVEECLRGTGVHN